MKHLIGKHVFVQCDLNIGDKVTTDVGGYRTKDKPMIIEDIKFVGFGETGFNIKVDGYPNYIDSNWIEKL